MSNKLQIHIGGTLQDSKRRVLDAVARSKRGETVSENHLTFENWEALAKVMSGKRQQMLRYLHEHPTSSIRALAKALGRDYKRVHSDVQALSFAGLIERNGKELHADYDTIQATIPL
jgi:predicted transcriptional regulator